MAQQKDEKQTTIRYTELIIYGSIFLVLVASVFVVNLILSQDSKRDAEQIFCATKQQEFWQKSLTYVSNTQTGFVLLNGMIEQANIDPDLYPMISPRIDTIRLTDEQIAAALKKSKGKPIETYQLIIAPIDTALIPQIISKREAIYADFTKYREALEMYGKTVAAMQYGGILDIDGASIEVTPVTDPRAKATVDTSFAHWDEKKENLMKIFKTFEQTKKIDQVALEAAVDYSIVNDDIVLSSTRDFIVTLGQLASERSKRLQIFQLAALISSLLVFAFMAIRLTISLRRQSKIISESQDQLVQSEKMASLGQMVAGLAHEMNTPLGFVRSNVEIISANEIDLLEAVEAAGEMTAAIEKQDFETLSKVAPSAIQKVTSVQKIGIVDENKSLLTSTLEGLDRIQELISNLKNFSRLDQANQQRANINNCLDSTLVIANHILKRHMTVTKNYANVPDILCSAAQLNQVFLNIITNAAHACEEKGQGSLLIKTSTQGNDLIVQISDNGKGIPQEVISKIFDPFFTTKPVGKGTGLGLSISKKIIEVGHKGRIEVKSRVGHGTDFFIYLPIKKAGDEKVEQVFSNESVLN
ncbi:MAG: ATP-binding protein [Chloroherpetonaceae bacterium]|nr:ATP-binding protein [Chloroherpetonaceae bacterium]